MSLHPAILLRCSTFQNYILLKLLRKANSGKTIDLTVEEYTVEQWLPIVHDCSLICSGGSRISRSGGANSPGGGSKYDFAKFSGILHEY